MKKLLLISYFFPPSNFVGAQRTAYWAENLHKFGYYPIVITRQWNKDQSTLTESIIHNELSIEKYDGYEVHRLPYTETLRDKLDQKRKFKYLQKALTLKEIIASNFFISALPYANFYNYSKEIIKSDKEIKFVLASGRPFQSFAIGHQLKINFPYLYWIPDYRDEWTTNKTVGSSGILGWLDKKSEVKWTSNSKFFLGTSKTWVRRISSFTGNGGEIVSNGFILNESKDECLVSTNKKLTLTYAGSVYQNQFFELILKSVKSFTENVIVQFVGIEGNSHKKSEITALAKENNIEISFISRCSKKELETHYRNSDLMFLTELKGHKDWLPVKLFDYFQTGKPILLCPSDKDVMEEFIRKTNSGYVANTVEECTEILQTLLDKKKAGESIALDRNMEEAYFYSREYQTKKLAEILDSL